MIDAFPLIACVWMSRAVGYTFCLRMVIGSYHLRLQSFFTTLTLADWSSCRQLYQYAPVASLLSGTFVD